MDFGGVLDQLSGFLRERSQPYAVVGGIALGGYGMARATLDLDLVLDASIQDEMITFMESLGYETVYRSSGYSNHHHSDSARGAVDFVYVRAGTSRKLFDAVRQVDGPAGTQVPVPCPEHLIAMKIMAMKNDPSRVLQDLADVRFLMQRDDVDRNWVRTQFDKRGLLERFDELERT